MFLTGDAHIFWNVCEVESTNTDLVLNGLRGVNIGQRLFGAHELSLPVRWYDTHHMEHMRGKHPFRSVLDQQSHFGRVILGPVKVKRDGGDVNSLPDWTLEECDK